MTLTTRVVVRSLIVMALVAGVVVLLTYQLVRVSGRSDLDRLLRDEAASLGAALAEAMAESAGLDGVLSPPEAQRAARLALATHPSSARHVSLVSVGGVRLQSTGGPSDVAALMRGADAPAPEPGAIRSLDTSAGPLRVLDVDVLAESGAPVATVSIVASLDPARQAANSVLRRAAVAGAIGIALGGLALWLVVSRSLRPLRDVSTATQSISPADLTARVPVPAGGDEVSDLATEINEMLSRIEQADATRRRYLAAVSHEVRTPLAVAEGHLELLASEDADIVRGELDRLRRVLDDLLAVARGSGEIDVRSEPVFLPDLFDAVRARVEALPLGSAVTIESPPPLVLLGDQSRVEQCLANLIANAVDHNRGGTRVTVTAAASDDSVALLVADDGQGIDPDLLPHVMEPFVTTREAGSGRTSGLGLAVVRALVEAQGGRIELDSNAAGTTATIRLPRATA